MKSKVYIVFFLVVWLAQMLLPDFYFQVEKNRIYTENKKNKSKIKASNNFFFFENEEEIKWLVEGKEFSVNDKNYDVLDIQKLKNGLQIQCYADEEEDSLYLKYMFLKKKKTKHHRTSTIQKKMGFISKLSFSSFTKININQLDNPWSNFNENSYSSFIKEIILPPPKQNDFVS